MPDVIEILIAAEPIEAKSIYKALEKTSGLKVSHIISEYRQVPEAVLNTKPHAVVIDFEASPSLALEAVQKIMADQPTPIILLYSALNDGEKISDVILAGALSTVKKPESIDWLNHPEAVRELVECIRIYSKIKVIRHVAAHQNKNISHVDKKYGEIRVVAIASSTGGPQALKEVLSKLPQHFPAAILVVQHITKGFTKGLVEWLNQECSLIVKEAVDNERVKSGIIYIAPEGKHLTVIPGSRIRLDGTEPVGSHVPSGNVLLRSVAKVYGTRSIGLVLTGMGTDGAKGLMAIKEAGGRTIAQDKTTSAVYGMPRAAAECGAADEILPIKRIASRVTKIVSET